MEVADFYYLTSEVSYHHFCCSLLVTQTNRCTLWEGTIQECEYQKEASLEAVLDSGLTV